MWRAPVSPIRGAAAACIALAFLSGCGHQEAATPTPTPSKTVAITPSPTPVDFTALPDHVDRLKGTPLVTVAPDVQAQMKVHNPEEGAAYFVLLHPQHPDQGVLVAVPNMSPATLQAQPVQNMEISGPVKTLDDKALRDWFVGRMGLHLAERDGKLAYILPDARLFGPNATPSPGAAVNAPVPGASPVPGDVTTPAEGDAVLKPSATPSASPSGQAGH